MVEAAGIDLLNLLLILTVALVFGLLAERAGYPALMGEILAGIVFGPASIGLLEPSGTIEILAELSVFLLMLYVGMEININDLFALGPQSLIIELGGSSSRSGSATGSGWSPGWVSNSRCSSASRWP